MGKSNSPLPWCTNLLLKSHLISISDKDLLKGLHAGCTSFRKREIQGTILHLRQALEEGLGIERKGTHLLLCWQ